MVRNSGGGGFAGAEQEPGIKLKLSDFKKKPKAGKYNPKDVVLLVDEMAELLASDDFRAVSTIKEALGSIARLGRASGFHLELAMQKMTNSTIGGELANNIHQFVVLGDFDSGTSNSMFEQDISFKSKPEIKGRGFSKNGKEITEFQSFWTEPDKDFKFVDKTLFDKMLDLRGNETEDENLNDENDNYEDNDNVFDGPSDEDLIMESMRNKMPERKMSRAVLDENGEIDYDKLM